MKKRRSTSPGVPHRGQAPVDAASLHGVDRMWCTQRDLAVPDMVGQKAACITRKATTAFTFTDDVGEITVDKVKTRRGYYIPPCARNAMVK